MSNRMKPGRKRLFPFANRVTAMSTFDVFFVTQSCSLGPDFFLSRSLFDCDVKRHGLVATRNETISAYLPVIRSNGTSCVYIIKARKAALSDANVVGSIGRRDYSMSQWPSTDSWMMMTNVDRYVFGIQEIVTESLFEVPFFFRIDRLGRRPACPATRFP